MRRYENRSTIMTSNRPLEEWGKLLSDVPTAGAILDRFLHHAQVIAINGKSYRLKEAPVVTQAGNPYPRLRWYDPQNWAFAVSPPSRLICLSNGASGGWNNDSR